MIKDALPIGSEKLCCEDVTAHSSHAVMVFILLKSYLNGLQSTQVVMEEQPPQAII